MNNYEIERKLNDKVDKWEFHNAQNENRQLKNDIQELKKQISSLESTNNSRYYVLEKLLNILAEHPQFSDIADQFYTLRSNL